MSAAPDVKVRVRVGVRVRAGFVSRRLGAGAGAGPGEHTSWLISASREGGSSRSCEAATPRRASRTTSCAGGGGVGSGGRPSWGAAAALCFRLPLPAGTGGVGPGVASTAAGEPGAPSCAPSCRIHACWREDARSLLDWGAAWLPRVAAWLPRVTACDAEGCSLGA